MGERYAPDFRRTGRFNADGGRDGELFGCAIAVNDNQLRPVCRANERDTSPWGGAEGNISPEEAKTFAMSRHENISRREPFLYQTEESTCYCTNMYIHELYWGLVTVECPNGAPSSGEKALYDYFYRLVYMTVCRLNRKENNLLITPKSVFFDLLNCMPFNNYIVIFFPLHVGEQEEIYYEDVERFFRESDLHAGVSYPFSELPKARGYFRQATAALKAISERGMGEFLGTFRNHALSIALAGSTGEFTASTSLNFSPLPTMKLTKFQSSSTGPGLPEKKSVMRSTAPQTRRTLWKKSFGRRRFPSTEKK